MKILISYLIKGVYDRGPDKKYPKSRATCKPRQTMDERESVEQNVETVSRPEEFVSFLSNYRMSKDENYRHYNEQKNSR